MDQPIQRNESFSNPNLEIVIQAGGQSTRMGQNKALLPFLGEPLILRVAQRLARLTPHLTIIGNPPEPFHRLGFNALPDRITGRGPLGGLYTALACSVQEFVAVVACDMPFVNARLISYAVEILSAGDWDAALPESAQGLEPLHAVYRRVACLEPVFQSLQNGENQLSAWVKSIKYRAIALGETRRFDPALLAFININTPDDLKNAEQIARQINHEWS